jgi:hypothetical protein
MSIVTKNDPGRDAWMFDDSVVRLHEWGSDRSYELPTEPSEAVTIGSSDTCSLQLTDPSGWLSRQHARLVREGSWWIARDLDSTNGMRIDGTRRPKMLLEPGCELGLGGITLVAESPRLIELRSFLARILGWASTRSETIDFAVRSVRLAATQRATLALCGDGDLVPVARGLHRYALGADRSFVLCDPRRRATSPGAARENHTSGMRALQAAAGGTLCVRAKCLPRDFAELSAAIRDPSARVQLIMCGQRLADRTELISAPIKIPALSTRPQELDRIIDEYAYDAARMLRSSAPFTKVDRDWVRKHSSASLPEIEKGASRILALREAGNIARAAALLGMGHTSLGEWIGRRRLPMGSLK